MSTHQPTPGQKSLLTASVEPLPHLIQPNIMPVAEILDEIERPSRKFARTAVEAAIARREEIIPDLLRILEHTLQNLTAIQDGYNGHLYSMFLLAQFREPRAYPLFLKFCLLDGERLDCLFGYVVTEDLARLVASVCGGDVTAIEPIIENENADEWVRGCLLDVPTTLVGEGQRSRQAVIEYFAQLFRGKLEREPSEVWNSLVAAACDIYPAELLEDINQAYRERLVDPGNISMEDVRRDLAMGKHRVLARLAQERHHRMVRDTVKEMEWWECFQSDCTQDVEPVPAVFTSIPVDRISAPPKVGRNESCRCGSGKNYKKCCGS